MTSVSVPPWPPCCPIADFETQVAADGLEALERLAAFNADVIVADLVMPRMDGFELLRHLKERGDLTPAIALTGFGSMEKALSAVHDLKAFWFLEKPVEPRAFKTLLDRAIRYKRSLQKTEELKRDLSLRGVLGDMVGTSPAMQRIFAIIRQVAPTSAPVLIRGESVYSILHVRTACNNKKAFINNELDQAGD